MLVAVDTVHKNGECYESTQQKYPLYIRIESILLNHGHHASVPKSGGEPPFVTLLEAPQNKIGRYTSIDKVVIQSSLVHSSKPWHFPTTCADDTRLQMTTLALQLPLKVGIELPPDAMGSDACGFILQSC